MSERRVRCLVPGCPRTRKPDRFAEWVCSNHWRATPEAFRLHHRRAKAQLRRCEKRRGARFEVAFAARREAEAWAAIRAFWEPPLAMARTSLDAALAEIGVLEPSDGAADEAES